MSEDVKNFSDNPGLPANEHAKKISREQMGKAHKAKLEAAELAKAKKHADKEEAKKLQAQYDAEKGQKIIFTKKGDKILKMTFNAKGVKSEYVGNIKKHKVELEKFVAECKKDNNWMGQDEYEEKKSEIRAKLAGE
jgi:hypothetical protein